MRTGTLTSPKLIVPVQIARGIGPRIPTCLARYTPREGLEAPARLVSMSTIEGGQAVSASNAETRFDIDRQWGESINNVGGDQTINFGGRGRSVVVGKVLRAIGLALSLG